MNVKIKGTNEVKELVAIDNKSGCEWTQDLIGNAGELINGNFTPDDTDDVLVCNQDTYDWWVNYINDMTKTEQEAAELAEELDIDLNIITDRIGKNTGCDYNDNRGEAIQAMDEIREEYAE